MICQTRPSNTNYMNDKKLKMILEHLDKLDQLEMQLKKLKTEYATNER
jgi:hypothetical protein